MALQATIPTTGVTAAPLPDHLRQFPAEDAAALVSGLLRILAGGMPYALSLELSDFAKSRTLHDCLRIERTLRHAGGERRELAAMVLASIPEDLRRLVPGRAV